MEHDIIQRDETRRLWVIPEDVMEALSPEERLVVLARDLERKGLMPGVDPVEAMGKLCHSVAQSQAERAAKTSPQMFAVGDLGVGFNEPSVKQLHNDLYPRIENLDEVLKSPLRGRRFSLVDSRYLPPVQMVDTPEGGMVPYEPWPVKIHPRHRWYNRLGRWIGLWVARQAVPA